MPLYIHQICVTEVGSVEPCPVEIRFSPAFGKTNPLQGRACYVNTHERNTVLIQFLQGFNPATTATFPLGGVDNLPCLVMLLLHTIA